MKYKCDYELTMRWKQGDRNALADLMKKYVPYIERRWSEFKYRIPMFDKDDMLQELSIQMMRTLDWADENRITPGFLMLPLMNRHITRIFSHMNSLNKFKPVSLENTHEFTNGVPGEALIDILIKSYKDNQHEYYRLIPKMRQYFPNRGLYKIFRALALGYGYAEMSSMSLVEKNVTRHALRERMVKNRRYFITATNELISCLTDK